MKFALFTLLIAFKYQEIEAHGRLLDPPSRSSCWREFPKKCVVEYTDNQQYCGGANVQWEQNKGKCGICGDDWEGPKLYERGGDRYPDFVVRTYESGQVIEVKVELTANQKGWFEFRLCDADYLYEQGLDADHKCLDKNLLKDLDGKSRFMIDPKEFQFKFKLVLPSGLTCKRCVFQWKYHSGNRYGIDPITKEGGRGLGIQEEFYGCSDVTIDSSSTTKKNKFFSTSFKRTTTQPIVTEELTTEEMITIEEITEEIIDEEIPTTTRSISLCSKDGYFPDVSKDCTEYYICKNYVKINQIKCPNDLKFNKELNICDWPSASKCF